MKSNATHEALERIESIQKVISASERAYFSGPRMMAIGILVALIPVIELSTRGMTFGRDFGPHGDLWVTLIHVVVYWALFKGVLSNLPFKRQSKDELHPMMRKAFSVARPLVLTIFGVIFVFTATDHTDLIHPVVFLLLGILFILYGKFSIRAVTVIGWSFIIAGLAEVLLIPQHIPHLGFALVIYNGLAYVAMGYFLQRSHSQDDLHSQKKALA